MQRTTSRSLDQIVGDQIAKWQQQRAAEKKKAAAHLPTPCITISRDPGSGGGSVARILAKDLGMDLIGVQIIQQVAERADVSEKVISSLDEKEVRLRDLWLSSFFRTRHIWPDEYLDHLTKVIGTIGQQGNAILMGRGSQFILPPEETFRLRFIAPRDFRIRYIMKDRNADIETAERYVYKTEADRNAFHCKYFNSDWKDPLHYDLVVNTGNIGIEGSAALVKVAFAAWKEKRNPRPSRTDER